MKMGDRFIAIRSDEGTGLYLFDTDNGDIKVTIDHYSQGPDEYESITDFDIQDGRYVKIMDRQNASINYYDIESADIVKSEHLPFSADRFSQYDTGRFVFYQNPMTATLNDEEYQYKFILTDENFNVIERSVSWDMESEHHQPRVQLDLGNMFYPSGGGVIYSQWDNDSLYTISGDSVYFSKIYDFGSQNRKYPDEPFIDLNEILNYYIYENEDFVGMSQGMLSYGDYKLSNFYSDGSIFAIKEHNEEEQPQVIRHFKEPESGLPLPPPRLSRGETIWAAIDHDFAEQIISNYEVDGNTAYAELLNEISDLEKKPHLVSYQLKN